MSDEDNKHAAEIWHRSARTICPANLKVSAQVLGLAIGFIMGTYIGKVVSALVQDIIMLIPGALILGGDWRKAVFSIPVGNGMNFAVGDFRRDGLNDTQASVPSSFDDLD